MVMVRRVRASDEQAWRDMWAAYCAFYKNELPEEVTDATWSRFFDPSVQVRCLIAEDGGQSVGFATYVLHLYTWGANPVCYLEDLFVREEARGRRVGQALIDKLIGMAESEDWDRVYWHTQGVNAPARKLYDRFVPADDFVRYLIDTKGRGGEKNVLPFPDKRGEKPPHDRNR